MTGFSAFGDQKTAPSRALPPQLIALRCTSRPGKNWARTAVRYRIGRAVRFSRRAAPEKPSARSRLASRGQGLRGILQWLATSA